MSEEKKTRQPLPVQDGLTRTAEIVVGESGTLGCEIVFRPATGLRAMRWDVDQKMADGATYERMVEAIICEHVLEIRDVVSGLSKGTAKPKESSVKELVKVLDAGTLFAIVQKIIVSSWDVDKLLGN